MSKQFPLNPSLRSFQNQAKQLLKAHQSGSLSAAERLRGQLSRLADTSDAEILGESLTLRDVQHVIAREYGFDQWTDLRKSVDSRTSASASTADQSASLAEGKTKIVRANLADSSTVYLYFKDDITAGDGLKHDVFDGKAALDWAVSRDCFEYLNRHGIRTHYVSSPEERVMLVQRLDRKIDLEVVSRRIATGSMLKWSDHTEGTRFDPVVTRFHYKDDPMHDPMLDETYVEFMIRDKNAWEYEAMREMNAQVFLLLESAFARLDFQLVDIKLEYGIINGELRLIDEISGGSFRLWPYRTERPNLVQDNVLGELAPEQRLDKDTYRMGAGSDEVLSKFRAISEVTARFKEMA